MRRVVLTVNDEAKREYEGIPDILLKHVGAFAPLLEQTTTDALPLPLADEAEVETAHKMVQWLLHEPLDELVTNMVQFRALATCADKFNVSRLLDDLAVLFCFFSFSLSTRLQ